MAAIDNLLGALDKVKATGHGKWKACCPVHSDKTPSLAIKEDAGHIVMHCFGCGASGVQVIEALGMDISDLFPPTNEERKGQRKPFSASDLLDLLQYETGVVLIAASDVIAGKPISAEDHQRVVTAFKRINLAADYGRY
jgi:hypothetical protein